MTAVTIGIDEYTYFTQKFMGLTGIDLSLYKRPQMERRITTLRDRRGFSNFPSYLKALAKDEGLLSEFLDKMTINVSEFYRNPERWVEITPVIHGLAKKAGRLKIWSSACSTGEEPYTLSMIMEEDIKSPYEILATDIDENVISKAKKGSYKEIQMKNIPAHHKEKYFKKVGDNWFISDVLRKHVKYQLFNLLADKYPEGMDLIVCRNVLIYFTDEAKQRVVELFAKSLKVGGILFVGSTEQLNRTDFCGLSPTGSFMYQKVK